MRSAIFTVTALFVGLCLGSPAWAGDLTLSRDRLEFGKMKEGLKAEKVVVLTNSGPDRLKIANVKTS